MFPAFVDGCRAFFLHVRVSILDVVGRFLHR